MSKAREKIDESEQWLLDGKCHICRRKEYCSKPCTRCKRRNTYEVRNAVRGAIARILSR